MIKRFVDTSMLYRSPERFARNNNKHIPSVTNINRSGDRGNTYLNPLWAWKKWDGEP